MPSANPTPLPLDAAARDELARKAEAATPGPWTVEVDRDGMVEVWRRDDALAHVCQTGWQEVLSSRYDAEFIAACSPDVILALLASVRGAEADTRDAERLSQAFMRGDMWCTDDGRWMCNYTVGTVGRGAAGDTPLAALRAAAAARAHPPTKETDDA